MLTIHDITWVEEGIKPEKPVSVIFECLYVPPSPLFIIDGNAKRKILSLKYYTINFERKSFSSCIAQFLSEYGSIQQVCINGSTECDHIHIEGIDCSQLTE